MSRIKNNPTLKRLILQTGRWNDASCSELNTFVCKMPKAHYPLPSVRPTVYGCPQVGGTHVHELTRTFTPHGWRLTRLCPSPGLGGLRVLLLLDGGDGQDLVRCQRVLQDPGRGPGARRRPVSTNTHVKKQTTQSQRVILSFHPCC